MDTFNDVKELVSTLKREEGLISEMFTKRKALNYKKSYALSLVDDNKERIDFLLQRSVIRENGGFLEIDDQFLEFFEQVLDVNEEINLSYIDENIKSIKENINYYLNEKNEKQGYGYLRFIKKTFRKIGITTFKSTVDLRRNIENTFKNESNYKNKQLKLENLDEKRTIVKGLIDQTLLLINNEEPTFFSRATDEELNRIIGDLKYSLSECAHNLIEIEKQIIDYLNQIKHKGRFLEKLRKLKYLKDQFLIKSETDIEQILASKNQVIFEKRIVEPVNLSINFLRNDENAFSIIKKIARKNKDKLNYIPLIADSISDEYLENSVEEEVMIDLEEVRNSFINTSNHLYNFIANYDFSKKVDFNERVTIFCQMASQFESEFKFEDEFQIDNNVEYTLIYPK
ncbi:FIG00897884: hypothetical protein [hydrothermal vent metagenome]|uniref:Uncharacterized protein n=1 Tax=hydrothermal vent metagenome TaxID=652676 RepID=A0A1W1E3V0_9ZZZZ